MISIEKKSELLGAEKYGQCASCAIEIGSCRDIDIE